MRLRVTVSVFLAAAVGLTACGVVGGSEKPKAQYATVFDAAKAGDWAGIRECMRSLGGEVTQRDANGDTVLHYAALGGNEDVIRNLVALGADPNARDADGKTPLQIAQEAGQEKAAKVLNELAGAP